MSLLKIKAFSIDTTDTFTFANANITTTLNGNIANFSGNVTGANANLGNLVTANYFSGNGSLLTGIVAVTANYAAYAGNVTTAAQPNITSVGTLSSLAVTGNVTTGNVSGTTGTFTTVAGTLSTAAQPNITSVGTLTGLTVNGDATLTGNLIVAGTTTYVNSTITAIKDPIVEQGSGANSAALTSDDGMDRGSLLHYYTGGATRDAFMGWKNSTGEFTFASNVTNANNVVTINALGNIKAGSANLGNLVTSNYFSGNGSLLTSINGSNVTGQVANALVAGTVTTAAQPNITSVGTLTSLAVTANITAGNITGGNLVTSNYFSGNGSLLTSITGANVTGQVANALAATTAGTVTTATQPNITSVGTLTGVTSTGTINFTGASNVSLGAVGNVKVTGGSSGQYLQTDGTGNLVWATVSSAVSSVSNGTSNLAIATNGNITLNVAGSTIETISSGGSNITGYMTATGNVSGGNLTTAGLVSATGNVTGGNLTTGGALSVTGNANVGNIGAAAGVFTANISALNANLGNLVTSNYFSGNGSLLTSITGANVTGQVGNALVAGTVYTSAQPNITSVGTLTSLAVTGTITGGNANVTGQIISTVATGTAPLVVTSTTQVANLNAATAGTVTTAAQPNITSVGALSSLSVTGTVSLGSIANLYIPGGSAGYVIKTDGSGNLSFAAASASGNANIAGANTQLFFNDAGSNTLGASAGLTFNKSTNTLNATNLAVSGTTNLGAVGNVTITGGSANYLLKTDGAGSLSWYNPTYTTVGADGFTGDGTRTAFTLTTTPTNANYTIVSVGGVVQPKTTYSVSGNVVTFSSAPPATAPVEVQTINTGITAVSTGGGGGTGLTYQGISTNTTLAAGNSYIVNTSSANLTLTLPASSTLGDVIGIIDGTGTAASHAITITGANIMGSSGDMVITTNRAAFQIVYYNSTQGWVLTSV